MTVEILSQAPISPRRWLMMRSVRSTIGRVRQSVKSSRSLFLMISLMFLVSDIIFVTMNYHFSKSALQDEWEQTWRQTAATYDLAVADQLQMMLLLAEFVGQDEEVRELFLAGARAVEAEGGGPGGHARPRRAKRSISGSSPPGSAYRPGSTCASCISIWGRAR